jgi:micrococcal nuclease
MQAGGLLSWLERAERRRRPGLVFLILLVGSCVIAACSGDDPSGRVCVSVTDGDTIVLDGGERVRLIGVDTPELHDPRKPVQPFAREAKAFTQKRVGGRRVKLEYDQTRLDRFGRTLAYVFLEDGTLLNLRIIEEGYGFAYTKYPFRDDYMERFRQAEREARDRNRGLWAAR